MSFIAVAMASGGADLSDEQPARPSGRRRFTLTCWSAGCSTWFWSRTARHASPAWCCTRFAGWTYWLAGVEQAGFCLDAEVVRTRRLRAADGATMLILYAVGGARCWQRTDGVAGAGRTWPGDAVVAIVQLVLTAVHWTRGGRSTSASPGARRGAGGAASLAIRARRGCARCRASFEPWRRGGLAAARCRCSSSRSCSRRRQRQSRRIVLRGIVRRALPVLARLRPPRMHGDRGRRLSAGRRRDVRRLGAAAVVALAIQSHVWRASPMRSRGASRASWLARAVVVGVAAFA